MSNKIREAIETEVNGFLRRVINRTVKDIPEVAVTEFEDALDDSVRSAIADVISSAKEEERCEQEFYKKELKDRITTLEGNTKNLEATVDALRKRNNKLHEANVRYEKTVREKNRLIANAEINPTVVERMEEEIEFLRDLLMATVTKDNA